MILGKHSRMCLCAFDAMLVIIRRAQAPHARLGRVHLAGFVLHDLLSFSQLRLSLLEFRDAIMRVCLGLVFLLGAAEQVHPACSADVLRPRAPRFVLVCARSAAMRAVLYVAPCWRRAARTPTRTDTHRPCTRRQVCGPAG